MSKLLLFSFLALCTAAFAAAVDSSATQSPNEPVAAPVNPFAGMPQGLNASGDSQTDISEQDRMCLRIHAFIFKTDDDREPQLVRETTCMPATASAKKADLSVHPKLMPADSSNRF